MCYHSDDLLLIGRSFKHCANWLQIIIIVIIIINIGLFRLQEDIKFFVLFSGCSYTAANFIYLFHIVVAGSDNEVLNGRWT
jgi:hypothetical protein